MRGASPREICLTSRSQASSSTRAGREQAPGERPGRDGPACSKDDTATEARVRAAAESGEWGGGVLVWKSPPGSWRSSTFWEELPTQDSVSFLTTPLCFYIIGQGPTGSTAPPPAPWTLPLPVSRALSVRSPRALMSRKGLFPMPMETICCTRSSGEQRPCLQPSLGPPASGLAHCC